MDTISEALNNSFAMMIQSFITITGTITMLLVLDWRLSLIVMVFCFSWFCSSVIMEKGQEDIYPAAEVPGKHQRLCGGDGGRTEGGKGI